MAQTCFVAGAITGSRVELVKSHQSIETLPNAREPSVPT